MKIHLLSNSNFSRFCFDETAKLCKVSDANFVRLLNKRVAKGNALNPHDFIPKPSAGKRTSEGTMSEHLCNSQWPKPHFWFRSEIWVSYLKKGVELSGQDWNYWKQANSSNGAIISSKYSTWSSNLMVYICVECDPIKCKVLVFKKLVSSQSDTYWELILFSDPNRQ